MSIVANFLLLKGLFINPIIRGLYDFGDCVMAQEENKRKKLIHETADLWFHTMVLLSYEGINAEEVLDELETRFGVSGLDEKASR